MKTSYNLFYIHSYFPKNFYTGGDVVRRFYLNIRSVKGGKIYGISINLNKFTAKLNASVLSKTCLLPEEKHPIPKDAHHITLLV